MTAKAHPRSSYIEPSPPSPPLSLVLFSAYLFLLPILGGALENLKPAALRVLLLAAAGLRLYEGRKPGGDPWKPRLSLPVLLYFGWAVLTALAGVNWRASYEFLLFLGAGLLTYALAADAAGHPHGRQWMFGGALAGGAAVGVWALREALLTPDPTWRAFSTFQGPNLLADYMLPIVFLGLAGALAGKRPWLMMISAAALFSSIGLTLTGSRGAVVYALPVALVVWLILAHFARDLSNSEALRIQRHRLAAILVAAIALGFFFLKPTVSRVGESASAGEAHSTQFRLLTWKGTLELIRERPLVGWGPGNWVDQYPRVARAGPTKAAHNGYLQIAAETGLPGALLWLWVLADGLRPYRKRDMGEAGRIAAIIGLALHNGVDYGWLVFAPAGITWALLGAGRRDALSHEHEEPLIREPDPSLKDPIVHAPRFKLHPPHAPPKRQASVASLAAVGAAALLTLLGLLPAYAEWEGMQAESALMAGDPVRANGYYARAAAVDFTNGDWLRSEADLLRAMGDPKGAVTKYQESIQRDPFRATTYYRLAQTELTLVQTADAQRDFEKALTLDPNSTPALRNLGDLEEEQGKKAEALERFRHIAAVEESPVGTVTALAEMEDANYSYARWKLAEDALGRGDKGEARKQIEAGLKSADAYLEGLKVWEPVMKASGRYNPKPAEEVQAAKQQLEEMKSKL